MKRSALGKGLDSLISMDDIQTGGSSAINEIPISQISPNPDQPRQNFDEEALEELATSIKELGIIQPLTLRSVGDNTYQIISGERRYRASLLAGLDTEYYPITPDRIGANNTVTITNTGDNMISVTNLKITGNQTIYNAANTPKASASPDATSEATEDVVPLVFDTVTMQTVKIAANNGVDPDAPAPVDPTPTPDDPTPTPGGFAELIQQLISAFVRNLFDSIARLFNH